MQSIQEYDPNTTFEDCWSPDFEKDTGYSAMRFAQMLNADKKFLDKKGREMQMEMTKNVQKLTDKMKIIDLTTINWGPTDQHNLQHFFGDSGQRYGLMIADKAGNRSIHSVSKKECQWLMSMNGLQSSEDQKVLTKLAAQLPEYDVASLVPPVSLVDTSEVSSDHQPDHELKVKRLGKKFELDGNRVYSDGKYFQVEVLGENGSLAQFDKEVGDWTIQFPSEGKEYYAINPKQFGQSFDVPVYARFDKQWNHVMYTTKRSLTEGCEVVLGNNHHKVTAQSINMLATKTIQRSIETGQPISHSLEQLSKEMQQSRSISNNIRPNKKKKHSLSR